MREAIFRKMPQQFLVAGVLFLLLGAWLERWIRAVGVSYTTSDFFGASYGTLMVFFGIIPIFFVSVGFCLVPPTRTTAWSTFVDRLALILFYVSAGAAVTALEERSTALFVFALSLNLLFGIASAVGFIARCLFIRENAEKRRLQATLFAFIGLSSWIIIAYALLEIAAIGQLTTMLLAGSSAIAYEAAPNDVTVPLIWKHLFWFLGHPEVIVFFTLFGGLVADGLRNLFVRRAVA
jgi:hypothetical protein